MAKVSTFAERESESAEINLIKFFGLTWVNNLHDGTFFHDMDTYARGFVAQRMQKVVPESEPQTTFTLLEISKTY